jgi:hypothetical protein
MNSKIKFLTTLVLISGVILLMGAGCLKKAVTPTPGAEERAPTGGAPAVEKKVVAPAVEMTGDLWVELTAQNNYHLGQGDLNWMREGGGWEKLLKEKGVTQEQYDAFTNLPSTIELMPKVEERLKELMSK